MDTQLKGNPSQGLWGATLGFFFGFAAVSLFGPTAKQFQEVMQLSPVLVGLLVAMPSLSGALLRIPFSAWVDTTGGRKPFLALMGLSVLGMMGLFLVVFFLYPDSLTVEMYPLLLLLGFLSGCGIATFSVGISQVSYWFPQNEQGKALGIYAGLGNLAPGIFSFLLPVALSAWGLAGSYLTWLFFLVFGTLLYFALGRNAWYFQLRAQSVEPEKARTIARRHGQQIFPSNSLLDSLRVSAKIWKTWVLVFIYFTTFGGFIALTAWLPTYWSTYFAVTAMTAGLLTALYSVLASAIRVGGGVIADKLGGENTAMLSLIVMLVGAGMMVGSDVLGLAVAGEVLMAISMGVCNAAVFKLVPQEVPEAVGGAAGWVGGLGAFGGFAIPPAMGLFVDGFGNPGYALGFLIFVGLAVAALACAFVLKRTHVPAAAGQSAPAVEATNPKMTRIESVQK